MYWVHSDTIIFYPEFNDELELELLCNYKKIIFSNIAFNENIYKDIYDDKKNNSINSNTSPSKTAGISSSFSTITAEVLAASFEATRLRGV